MRVRPNIFKLSCIRFVCNKPRRSPASSMWGRSPELRLSRGCFSRSCFRSSFTELRSFFVTVSVMLLFFYSRISSAGDARLYVQLGILWLVWGLCRYNSRKFSIVRLPFVCARSSDVRDRPSPRTHIRLRLYIYYFRAQDSMLVGSFPVLAASCTLSIQDSAHSQRRSHSPPKRSLISR